jgi:hypothetical protein
MAAPEQYIFWNPTAPAERKKLARYVLEGLDDIVVIFHEAKADLRELTGDPAFYGYVSGDWRRVHSEVKALYQRLQKGKPKEGGDQLTYVLEPTESGERGQGLDTSTHSFTRRRERVFCQSLKGHHIKPPGKGSIIHQHTFTRAIPQAGDENARINLWLMAGRAPANGKEAEIIISKFEFVPLP